MRFTAASVLAFAAGAVASASSSASVVTEVVTSYVTYCPEATSFVAGSSTVHVTTPGTYTLSGSYTVTRPLLSSTITICNSCSAGPTAPVPVGTGSPNPWSSAAVAPVASGTTTTSAVSPAYTGGASHAAAGAGAGLAAVFGAAAFLL